MNCINACYCYNDFGSNFQTSRVFVCFGTRFAVSEDKTVKYSDNQREREREIERERERSNQAVTRFADKRTQLEIIFTNKRSSIFNSGNDVCILSFYYTLLYIT
jgi:hypothetical protein